MKKFISIILCILLLLTGCGSNLEEAPFLMEEREGQPAFGHNESENETTGNISLEKDGIRSISMRTDFPNSSGGQVVIRCENHNDYDVALTTDLCFYDSQGTLVSTACEKNACIPAGEIGFLLFESETSFQSFSYDWTAVSAEAYHREALKSLVMSIEKDSTGQLCYSVTNEWEQQQELDALIFFFAEDSSLVGYDKQTLSIQGSGGICAGVFQEPVGEEYVIYADYVSLQ